MGYLDRQLTGSAAQSVAMAAGSVFSTDVIDLANSGRDISRANELRALCLVGAAVTSGGAATLTVELVQSANPDLSSPDVLYTTGAVALANLGAGAVLVDTAMPATTKRYLGWRFTVGAATTTGGTVTATITKNTHSAGISRPAGNTGIL